jgi:PAS domain S-box-containing protein
MPSSRSNGTASDNEFATMKRCPICAAVFPADQRFCAVHGLPLVQELAAGDHEDGALTGTVIDGRYRLAGVVGRGGMGVVYEAEQLRIGRRCAVKVLHPELHADPKMRMRLFREVQATSRVRHPNVIEILDFGDDPRAGSYLVMEFLEGRSLSEIIRMEAPLDVPAALRIAVQVAGGLGACHASGLIHRDLKPGNVRVLGGGQVKVLDFGLVKPYEPERAGEFVTITTGGIAFGTPWYMSPEQAGFQPLDPRTDIYSFGVMLYEMMVGRPPFTGENPLALIDAHRSQPVPLPSMLSPPVLLPPALEMLILKALSKDPAQRHQSVAELLEGLMRIAHQEGVTLDGVRIDGLSEAAAVPELCALGELTLPMPVADLSISYLQEAAAHHLDELGARIATVLQSVIPRYCGIDPEKLASGARLTLKTALEVCLSPSAELSAEMRRLADERSAQQFTPSEIIGAMWLELSMMRPLLLELARGAAEKAGQIEEQINQRMLGFIVKLSDYYFSRYHARLVDMNARLVAQNEELNKLRGALTDQLTQTSRQLVDAEQLKARVVENISSGVILVERATHIIRIYNRACEKLAGIPASQAVGRPIEEVLTFVEGVPYEEFLEQIQTHNEVGLRKLWLRMPSGAQKAVYVSGRGFHDSSGEAAYTLYLIEDVTERENIIESFSRFLSRDVVDHVLRRGRTLQPSGESRRVLMLAVNIRNFRRTSKDLPLEAVVELLTDYVRAVSEAVFHHGGTIETAAGDSLLVYFDRLRDSSLPAVQAAIELCRRLEAINVKRQQRGMPRINTGIGIHLGEVLVANVGSKRRMVHTVVGDAAQVANQLQEVASGGEILISAEVAAGLGQSFPLENGPLVSVEGHEKPVEVFRVPFELTPWPETPA